MPVENIKYTQPILGNSSSNPLYVSGSSEEAEGSGGLIGNDANPNDYSILVGDMTVRQLLEGILTELKIMNLRQQEAFEETVKEEDIQCE